MNEPRFEISRKKVLEKFDEVKEISDFVSYSSKTNPLITGILEEQRDCLFSIHSVHELKNIEDKSRVVFLAQGWDFVEIRFLVEKGIKFLVVDNVRDLDLLKDFMIGRHRSVYPKGSGAIERINLFLRLKLKENTLRTEKHFVFGFRSDFINSEILKLKELDWVENVGVHFHRKTQNVAEWDLKREIENVLDEEVLKGLDSVILGGGLPSVYANTNVKIFNGIFEKIKEFREWLNSFGIKVVIEPGRYIAAPSGRLVCQVKSVYEKNIIVNVSVYNTDMDALIVPVKLLVENELSAPLGVLQNSECRGNGEGYVVKGITPCSMDLFRYRVYLKEEPKVGDEFVFLNAGAYNFSTDFCDLPLVESLVVD